MTNSPNVMHRRSALWLKRTTSQSIWRWDRVPADWGRLLVIGCTAVSCTLVGWGRSAHTVIGQETERPSSVRGDAVIAREFSGDKIAITTTHRLAGAIDSVVWKNQEFIDSIDHGRQLQSAVSMDCSRTGLFWPECYNPTEAGSRIDGAGANSTSQLLDIRVDAHSLWTRIRPAFWLAPHEKSSGHPALNRDTVSSLEIQKRVTIGIELGGRLIPNLIDYRVAFRIPESEKHTKIQFESLTGYMPPTFSRFYALDWNAKKRVAIDDGPGEQPLPLLFTTEDEMFAMGCLPIERPRWKSLLTTDPFAESSIGTDVPPSKEANCSGPGFGRFRFEAERVVKWNCVYRSTSDTSVPPGWYVFRFVVPIGTAREVETQMLMLTDLSGKP